MNKHLITLSISLLVGSAFSQTPTLEDAKNLAQVMSGAWEKNSDDIPKDERGRPAYLIGNLGGKPVRLPQGVVHLVEYDDSPGWNVEKIRNYKPPKRTYDSIIESFGFEFRYTDGLLFNLSNSKIYKEYRNEKYKKGSNWIRVTISSGSRYGKNYVNNHFEDLFRCVNDFSCYTPLNEEIYGLSIYIILGINPQTGIPWRKDHHYGYDYFVAFNQKGEPSTIIECSNNNVQQPPCDHDFVLKEPIEINVSLLYSKDILKDWKIIEEMAKKFLVGFIVENNK